MRAIHVFLTHFAQPRALFLLAVLPLLGVLGIAAQFRRRRVLTLLGSRPAVRSLMPVGRGRRVLVAVMQSLGFAVLVAAISGPQWGLDPEPALAAGRDLILVLDVSRSMLAEDVLPSRLGWSQQALAELIDDVQRRGGHRLGLVAFAGRARVLCALTPDYDHVREALRDLNPADPALAPLPGEDEPTSGTRIGAALAEAVGLHEARFRDYQDVLLLSDGDDPAGDAEWQDGVEAARRAGIPIYTVGVGNPQLDSEIPDRQGRPLQYGGKVIHTHLHEKPLEDIARLTGGTYLPAWNTRRPLSAWFLNWSRLRPGRDLDDDPLPALLPRYPWFFAAALALFGLAMLIGDGAARREAPRLPVASGARAAVLVPIALLLVSASPARDAENLVRMGNEAFLRGDFEQALDAFGRAEEFTTDPGLVALNEGAALYRLGRFREAEWHYLRALEDAEGERRARTQYDLANTLVHLCQGRDAALLDRAIGYYEACLKEPVLSEDLRTDAEHNLQLAQVLRQRARKAKKDTRASANPQPGPEIDPGQSNPSDPGEALSSAPDGRGPRPGTTGEPGKGEPGTSTQPRSPGTGNLPPVPDQDELVPLTPEDARSHLQQATQRIMGELQKQKSQQGRPTRNVLDW
jgi:Ca-activated chloride channel family protein